MGYNRENLRRIRREYDGKNLRVKEEAEARAAALRAQIPELALLDESLRATGMKIMDAASRFRGEALDAAIAALREENKELQARRRACLAANGFPADYTEPKYECDLCKDTGAYQMKMCRCMREKLVLAGYESSGIANLMRTQSFETFDPEYQSGAHLAEEYRGIVKACRRYAEEFNGKEGKNLLFYGGPGVGKTHLSTAIAKTVIENGFDVVYETASNLLSDFETERFDRAYRTDPDAPSLSARYFECDLLIIDDLGTEMTNQFTISVLYNLLNTRMNKALSTLISTNLPPEELRKRYTDRLASRLFGAYRPILFKGTDVRMKKIME